MNTSHDFKLDGTSPAALPPALEQRLLAAMQQAHDEELECREMENMLRRFHPAAMPAHLVGRVGVQMYVESQQKRFTGASPYRMKLSAAAVAAVALVAVCLPLVFLTTKIKSTSIINRFFSTFRAPKKERL